MRLLVRCVRALLVGLLIAVPLVSVLITENALRVPLRRTAGREAAVDLARLTQSTWQAASVSANDGAVLSGWLFEPRQPRGDAVILMHGVGDSRAGMTGLAGFLLDAGYTVLMPDARGHGASGGALITYGIREAADVHCWADWLCGTQAVERLYGLGASMGAATLLEALPREPRFRAIAADCPFADFESVSYDRLSQVTGAPAFLFWPVVNGGFAYARVRYGVDLRQASPVAAVHGTHVPILLIHGTADGNIPIGHSRRLHRANPAVSELWAVPGAHHVASYASQPEAYAKNVLAWFESHR